MQPPPVHAPHGCWACVGTVATAAWYAAQRAVEGVLSNEAFTTCGRTLAVLSVPDELGKWDRQANEWKVGIGI